MSFRSDEEYLFFELADPAIEFSVARMRGEEGISTLFEFQVELLSEDADITFEDVVGQSCVVSLMDHNHTEEDGSYNDAVSQERFFHGIVNHFEIAEEGTRFTTYHAVIVPKIWVMNHRENCRIFQEKSVKDIVTTLLTELGMDGKEYKWNCQKTYKPYEYCVQYRESEFNFMSRLLEQEGIFYYFEHDENGHVIIFHDDSPTLESLAEDDIPVVTQQGGMVSNQHIYAIKYTKSITPGKVTLRDYNFTKPAMGLESEKMGKADGSEDRELYQYPGWFQDKARGDFLADVRLKSTNTFKECIRGKSNVNTLTPGYSFFLDDDKTDSDYLITRVEHIAVQAQAYQEGSTTQGGRYNNRFIGIPLNVPFTAPRTSRTPIVEGTQTAIITGASGEEIYTDEHGRVKVQFHWDREGTADQNSSCWIRVSQMWAGQNYGGFMLPRVGQEVIVDFLEGNPDRPIITGRVHHGDNRTPYKLPDKKTISTLKTNSSKGGGGFNELRFDDAKGEEQIFIHAQHNQDVRIKNDYFEFVGNDRHNVVEKNHFEHIKENYHSIIDGESFKMIAKPAINIFKSDVNEQYKKEHGVRVEGDRKVKVKGDDNLTVSKEFHVKAKKDISIKTLTELHIKSAKALIAGDDELSLTSKKALIAGKDEVSLESKEVNITGKTQVNIKAGPSGVVIESAAKISFKVGGSLIVIDPSGVSIVGPMVKLNSGGAAGAAKAASAASNAIDASPVEPKDAKDPKQPIEAKPADDAEAGKVETVKSKAKPRKVSTYGPQAKALKHAAESGTPFCEECEAAKKEQQKKKKAGKS